MGGIFLAKAPHSPFVLGGVARGSSSSSSCAGEMAEILLMLSMVVEVFPRRCLLAGIDVRWFLHGGWSLPLSSS